MKITNVRILIMGGDGYANVSDVGILNHGGLEFTDAEGVRHFLSPAIRYHIVDQKSAKTLQAGDEAY